MAKTTKTIRSVEKAFEVLDLLAMNPDGLNATEIAQLMEQRVSGVFHLLVTLNELGIVHQDIQKRYTLGLKLWQLGQQVEQESNLIARLSPILKQLRDRTGETANMTVLHGEEILYVAQEASPNLLKSFTRLGATAPLHCTGSGKLLLAYINPAKQEKLLDSIDLVAFTANTLTTKSQLLTELTQIKAQGFAYDNEERESGVNCIGAPVFGHYDEVVACLSISGPTSRFTSENQARWTQIVQELAQQATELLQDNN